MTIPAPFAGTVIAESDETEVVEGSRYPAQEPMREGFFTPTEMTTVRPWNGLAGCYSVTVDDPTARNAAGQYERTAPPARRIRRHLAVYAWSEPTSDAADGRSR